ncbi:MAG TPA: hypothetical protein VGA63_04375 [Geopsychrobacteraceae bacterium]|jgi:hypothetical protein
MRVTTAHKSGTKEQSRVSFGTTLLVITFRVALVVTLLVMVVLGVWAVLALLGGLVASGDPITMIREWFKTVSGS